MIQIIIFSFNRALQLAALLNSIDKYWKGTPHKISVIYNTSNNEYQEGYDMLREKMQGVHFVKEHTGNFTYHFADYFKTFNWKKWIKYKHTRLQKSNFRDLVIKDIEESNCDYTMFLTDDSAFIADVILSEDLLSFIKEDTSQNQISLRLGNLHFQKPQEVSVNSDGFIRWQFSQHRKARSWGYNFSVDAHIYSTALLRELLTRVIFNNPTTLEGHICDYAQKNNLMNCGLTFEKPMILSFPINMVQKIAKNESLGVSEKELNDYYLKGYLLEYPIPEKIDRFQIYPPAITLVHSNTNEYLTINI